MRLLGEDLVRVGNGIGVDVVIVVQKRKTECGRTEWFLTEYRNEAQRMN